MHISKINASRKSCPLSTTSAPFLLTRRPHYDRNFRKNIIKKIHTYRHVGHFVILFPHVQNLQKENDRSSFQRNQGSRVTPILAGKLEFRSRKIPLQLVENRSGILSRSPKGTRLRRVPAKSIRLNSMRRFRRRDSHQKLLICILCS